MTLYHRHDLDRTGSRDSRRFQISSGARRGELVDRIHHAPKYLVEDHHLLVVEDDPRFTSHLVHLSRIWSLPMTIVPPPPTPAALKGLLGNGCDILLVNFDLAGVNGLEVAEYFNLFIRRIPTMLISGTVEFDRQRGELPPYIDAFVPKSKGAVHILVATLEMADRERHPENYPSVFNRKANVNGL